MTIAAREKYSLAIRLVCGILGLLGLGAVGFNVVQSGKLEISFILFASMFAGFIFLYVAFFGVNPLDTKGREEDRRD
jgi:hypothetical protein